MFSQKYLTADEFEEMTYKLAEANPDMSLGQCAITLYRTQEERNKKAEEEMQKDLADFRAKIFLLKTLGE